MAVAYRTEANISITPRLHDEVLRRAEQCLVSACDWTRSTLLNRSFSTTPPLFLKNENVLNEVNCSPPACLGVRCSKPQAERLRALARAEGLDYSAWARLVLYEVLHPPAPLVREVVMPPPPPSRRAHPPNVD